MKSFYKAAKSAIADDLSTKGAGSNEIYPKIKLFGTCGKTYHININWGKIEIVYKQNHFGRQAVREILPLKYRNIAFATNGLLLGQKITLNRQTNGTGCIKIRNINTTYYRKHGPEATTVLNRINKARAEWEILKKRLLRDETTKAKNKI